MVKAIYHHLIYFKHLAKKHINLMEILKETRGK